MHPSLHRFYFPSLNEEAVQKMEGEEVHHLGKVLRLKVGAEVILLDGRGGTAHGRILDLKKDKCLWELIQYKKGIDVRSGLHIAIAPTKQIDRLEWFLEKAVEMGLGHFTPLLTERGERSRLRMDRLEKVAISAMKQSLRTYLPHIGTAIQLQDFLSLESGTTRMIAHCYEGVKQEVVPNKGETIVLIGPEGDFTLDEVALAASSGYEALSLGSSRLRTETAALKAVALYNR